MAVDGNNDFDTEMLTVDYTTMLELLLQQQVSKLRGLIPSGAHTGKRASPIQFIGSVEFRAIEAKYAPITFQNPKYTRRWVTPNDRDCGVPVDIFDLLRSTTDPKTGINMAVMAAANRFFDQLIADAAFADAQTGEDAAALSTENWSTSYDVAADYGASADTGLTYDKFVEARRILEHAENDFDNGPTALAIMASLQTSQLRKQEEVISKDYSDKAIVENGRVTALGGFAVVQSERTPWASNVRNCIFGMPDGLYLGIWKDMTISVTQRTDLVGHPWQLYALLSAGATRTQLGKLVRVKCVDTVGLPIV